MINYGKQYIDSKDILEIQKTLKGNFLTQGPRIKIFEKKFQNIFLPIIRLLFQMDPQH